MNKLNINYLKEVNGGSESRAPGGNSLLFLIGTDALAICTQAANGPGTLRAITPNATPSDALNAIFGPVSVLTVEEKIALNCI
jgi:hypothetical protein